MKNHAKPANDNNFEFHGFTLEPVRKNEYIISLITDGGDVWSFVTKTIPIFNFYSTKIFQIMEDGMATSQGMEKGNEFYFSIQGVKVKKIYDFSPS